MGIIKEFFKERKARKIVLKTFDDAAIDEKIKIQGTVFDRKRKYSNELIATLRDEFKKGMAVSEIASKYGMNYTTVKYNVDPVFKKSYNEKRNGKHTGIDTCDFSNRVDYKKSLVRAKKIKVSGVI